VDLALQAAVGPVQSDLARTTGLTFSVRGEQWSDDPEMVTAFPLGRLGEQVGIRLTASDSEAKQEADIADQVQEWAIEELWGDGLSAVWPQCPEHPDTHPLAPVVQDGVAVWSCPVSHAVVAEIGSLEPEH
jgi:hypothetical protein